MNQSLFVGRLTGNPELTRLDNGKVTCQITVAVKRAFKNPQTDEYDTDFIPITYWEALAETVVRHTKKGSMVCCKCRAVPKIKEIHDTKVHIIEFVGEMINFISSKENLSEE